MKRLFCDLIIIVAFIPLYYLVALPFISELRIEEARAYEQGYGWGNADKMYNKAISINPFNAVHLKEYGNFVSKRAFYERDKLPMLEKAKSLYERALRLNRVDAGSWVSLGVAKTQILRSLVLPQNDRGVELVRNDMKIRDIMADFRKAVELDPNGFNTLYGVSSAGIDIWQYLDEDSKNFILKTIRQNINLSPTYEWRHFIRYICQRVWDLENDFNFLLAVTPSNMTAHNRLYWFIIQTGFLWEYRKEQAGRVDYYKQKEAPEDYAKEIEGRAELLRSLRSLAMTEGLEQWTGTSESGRNEYRDGKMYWTGTVHKAVDMPQGMSTIIIKARGSIAKGVWPYMIVELDGEEIGEIFVDSEEWKEYSFDVDTDAGIKVLSVTFPNDARDKDKEEDRNLYLGDVVVTRK